MSENAEHIRAAEIARGARGQFADAEAAGFNPYAADTGHTPAPTRQTLVSITSFGYLHGDQPTAESIFDLRDHFRDPHIDPRLVEEYAAVLARVARRADVTAALGCAGGRHRAPVISEYVAKILRRWGYEVEVIHRDLDKPVVEREVTQ